MFYKLINILLLTLSLQLAYVVYQALPSSKLIQDSDNLVQENIVLSSKNDVLVQKIQQVINNGPILQQNNRYYNGYVEENEIFYNIYGWE